MEEQKLPVYSYSKINCFYSCPYSFFQRYFDTPKDFVPVEHGTTQFGTYFHSILEAYEKNQLEEFEMLDYYVSHFYENITGTFELEMSEGYSVDMEEKYFEGGKRYLEQFNGFPEYDILESEYDFMIPVKDTFVLHGKVDLIATDKNGDLIIIDHKSKGKFKNKAEKEEYSRQLYLYAYAVYNKYGKFPKRLAFNMFRSGDWVEFKFDEKKYEQTLQWAVDSVNEIESAIEFPAILDTFYCRNFCAFKNVCQYRLNQYF